MNVDTLLFDMDGTLTDLWKRYRDPFYRAINKIKPDHDKKRLQKVFEKTVTEFLTTFEGNKILITLKLFRKSRKEMGGSLIDTFRVMKIVLSDPTAFRDVEPLEGVKSTLEILQKRGYRLALVTNASDKTVDVAKEKLKILKSFDILVTRNTVKRIKPHPEPLLYVCEQLEKNPSMCAMIGDFPQDIQAGKAAGTRTIAVLGDNGKYTEDKIRQLEPDVILETFGELLNIFPGNSE
ncbi:MAG: HAD family hydrolase [Candidatus Heimdallarchaeota archaeon]|nr:HAD family hydrolase [Candidatus Heimdallarchaeota archaeon]MCK4768817.1 HAD family hydrolase [Candidatus Heimdallarchaeota archaeon]